MPPRVDLVILLSARIQSINKAQVEENIQKVEEQYTRLLDLLRTNGLHAVGKRGEKPGDLMVLVGCSPKKLNKLASAERVMDFIVQVSAAYNSIATGNIISPSDADRVRLVHKYITSADRLAISPGIAQWSRVTDIIAIHDQELDEKWLRERSSLGIGPLDLDKIKDHFGEEVGLYFYFLATYTKALTVISALGGGFWLFGPSYFPYYTTALILCATAFVEYWAVVERKISIRWGTYSTFPCAYWVGGKRHDHIDSGSFSKNVLRRVARMVESVPVILGFAVVSAGILTSLYVIEAFIARMYTGPFHQHVDLLVGLLSMILFLTSIPNFLRVYQTFTIRLTNRENHEYQPTYHYSLAIKRFALSAIVVFLGLVFSVFIYTPFGYQLMAYIHNTQSELSEMAKATVSMGIWERATGGAAANFDTTKSQVYAYTVMFGLPYVVRFLGRLQGGAVGWNGKASATGGEERKEEQELLVRIRKEVALGGEYGMFERHLELVTQFAYVVFWSAIWPLAPVVALINTYVELRSGEFIGSKHLRRPIPVRADSIGPWLTCLRTLLWIAGLMNSVLVYVFRLHYFVTIPDTRQRATDYAILTLDVFAVLKWVVWFVVKRVFWRGSEEEMKSEEIERQVQDHDKVMAMIEATIGRLRGSGSDSAEDTDNFWKQDEGPWKDCDT